MSVSAIELSDIELAVKISGLQSFTGNYKELGGGEVNDTFILDCEGCQAILRITRYSDVRNLHQEAKALSLLDLTQVPKLIYYDETKLIKDRAWIVESYIEGSSVDKLSLVQFRSLGRLLAQVHKVSSSNQVKLDLWYNFLDASQHFGNEQTLLNHPDSQTQALIRKGHDYFQSQHFGDVTPSLVHGDVTLSNMLISGEQVSLIDWEFSKFKDPMADFSTMFYDDMEYNKGKWRIHIKPEEKVALFDGYTSAGGVVDEQRLKVWLTLDKLGAAVYLYWKINQSGHETTDEQLAQYRIDLANLTQSLEGNLT